MRRKKIARPKLGAPSRCRLSRSESANRVETCDESRHSRTVGDATAHQVWCGLSVRVPAKLLPLTGIINGMCRPRKKKPRAQEALAARSDNPQTAFLGFLGK